MQLYEYWIFFTKKQAVHFDSMSITEIGGPDMDKVKSKSKPYFGDKNSRDAIDHE